MVLRASSMNIMPGTEMQGPRSNFEIWAGAPLVTQYRGTQDTFSYPPYSAVTEMGLKLQLYGIFQVLRPQSRQLSAVHSNFTLRKVHGIFFKSLPIEPNDVN